MVLSVFPYPGADPQSYRGAPHRLRNMLPAPFASGKVGFPELLARFIPRYAMPDETVNSDHAYYSSTNNDLQIRLFSWLDRVHCKRVNVLLRAFPEARTPLTAVFNDVPATS